MSYSIVVRSAEGQVTVSTTGDVPDGEHTVSGHEDSATVQLGVIRRDRDGQYVAQASHQHWKGH